MGVSVAGDAPGGVVAEVEDEVFGGGGVDGEVSGGWAGVGVERELWRWGRGRASRVGWLWARESLSALMGVYSSVGSVPLLEWKRARRACTVSSASQGWWKRW